MRHFLFIISFVILFCSCKYNAEFLDGFALGTTYHIVYKRPSNRASRVEIHNLVEQAFFDVNASLSVYNNNSIISKVNRNEPVELDSLFIVVFNRGKEIHALTHGAFDMAAAPYFKIWGFGEGVRELPTQVKLDSIAHFAGMDKIEVLNGIITKADPRVSLNANAIAKGFSSDLIATRLMAVGIDNFLIEVGGEIYCKGVNPQGKKWSVAIDTPEFGNLIPGIERQATLLVSGVGLATSGNYRNYFDSNGQKMGHTIDPSTGRPAQHNLLSATVVASNCMSADAFATAFMVMGLELSILFLESHPYLDAYLIYKDESGSFQAYSTPNITLHI